MSRALRVFRPHRTPPEQLEKIFVAREPFLQEILERLDNWRPGGSRQHYLIIGPRGIGKTNLLQLLEHRIETSPQPVKKWYPISLSEDAYGITKITDLLIESLRILSDKTRDKAITDTYEQVRYDDDEQRVVDLSLDAFRKFHHQCGGGILLMVENVNRVLESQIRQKREIHLLRKILIEEDWLVFIGTSPTYLKAVTKPEEPLFEFFHVKLLLELSPEQQQEMLHKIALLEENTDFIENYLERLKPQLQALYHFTGGNPRLTIMLYDLIANQNITDAKDELDSLLDKLTPFYQDRMKEIAEQEAKLLEKMALLAEGCTPTELAKESRMEPKSVRTFLTRLERTGYVRREPRRKKRTVYIIPERFFRIWHQMNHSRSARGRIQYLLEFFTSWYATPEDREQVWEELAEQFEDVLVKNHEDRIEELNEYMQYIENISEGEEKYKRLFDRLYKISKTKGYDAVKGELANLDKEYQDDGHYYLNKGSFLLKRRGEKQSVLQAFRTANQLMPDNILALFRLGYSLDRFSRRDESEKIYNIIIERFRKEKDFGPDVDVADMLLQIFQEEEDVKIVKAVSVLLRKYPRQGVIERIIEITQAFDSPIKKQIGITTLGSMRSKAAVAVQPLIGCLKDEANNVRGSAATALGYIGSSLAVQPLLECLKDEANDVRGSAASALGHIDSELAVQPLIECLHDEAKNVRVSSLIALNKIASRKKIQQTDKIIEALIDVREKKLLDVEDKMIRRLLRSAFRTGNLDVITASVKHARKGFEINDEFFRPYIVALEYIKSGNDPAILERQQPEMREAVQLLTDSFYAGQQ